MLPPQLFKSEIDLKKSSSKRSPGSDDVTGEFCQTFRKELTPNLLKVFQKVAEGGTLPSSFYEDTITLIPNKTEISQKKKIEVQYLDDHRSKNPQDSSKPI